MKPFVYALLMVVGGSLPASAATTVTFDFTGPDHDDPIFGDNAICTAGGDHCGTTNLGFFEDNALIVAAGFENASVVDGVLIADRAGVIEDVSPDNGGLGVTGEEADNNVGFDTSEEQVNAANGEAIRFSFNQDTILGDIEFNAGNHMDCTAELCGTFDLYVWNAGLLNLVLSGADAVDQFLGYEGQIFVLIAAGETSEWYVGGVSGIVPEPATWLMMILGFGMIAARLKRRVRLPDAVV